MEIFLLRHGPARGLRNNATAKDFIKQFLDDDYLDQIVRYVVAYGRSKSDNNLTRKHSKVTPANSHSLCVSLTPADQRRRSRALREISHA